MNYDRFLTRVWDKELKKMSYLDEPIGDGGDILRAVTNYRMIISHKDSPKGVSGFWVFGDRFVPMTCTGLKDEDDELVYEGDIINSMLMNMSRAVIKRDDSFYNFRVLQDDKIISDLFTLKNFNIRGNIYEDPEFLEVKTNEHR